MVFYNFDYSKWDKTKGDGVGLVLLTTQTPTSIEDVELFLKEWEKVYTKCMEDNCKYTLVFDTRKVSKFDIKYLKLMGKWLKKMKTMTENWMDRTAIIVSNPIIKGFISFVFLIYKPVRPFKVFASDELVKSIEWSLSKNPGDDPEKLMSDVSTVGTA